MRGFTLDSREATHVPGFYGAWRRLYSPDLHLPSSSWLTAQQSHHHSGREVALVSVVRVVP